MRTSLFIVLALAACGSVSSSPDAAPAIDATPMIDAASMIAQQAYIKASNTGAGDHFGAIAISADGSTLAVCAFAEASAATGIGGNQADDSALDSGAAYVFTRTSTTWMQQAYIKASNTDAGDEFCSSVALSSDGSTLVIGAQNESSLATGVGGNQADNSAASAGAAYVFIRSGTAWTQQAYLKASNTGASDNFGFGVGISADGSTLAVSAIGEDSAAIGVDGNQADNSTPSSGAVYVFTRTGTMWRQQAYIKASNTDAGDLFGGNGVSFSGDGSTMAVGAYREDSAATGVGGNQADNSATDSGAVYVFTRTGTTWAQSAYIKASNTDAGDLFGYAVALSTDGSTLAVSAQFESSGATGIGGNQANNSAALSGAVYVFERTGMTWTQQAYIKASNTDAGDHFGNSVGISADGSTLAVGAQLEDSAATGVGGNQADFLATDSGAVYLFTRTGTTWAQEAYIKASNTDAGDRFGGGVALSANGSTLAVGAALESSAATGLGGNQADNSAPQSGAVYVFQ